MRTSGLAGVTSGSGARRWVCTRAVYGGGVVPDSVPGCGKASQGVGLDGERLWWSYGERGIREVVVVDARGEGGGRWYGDGDACLTSAPAGVRRASGEGGGLYRGRAGM